MPWPDLLFAFIVALLLATSVGTIWALWGNGDKGKDKDKGE
jgi:hypothetical protein